MKKTDNPKSVIIIGAGIGGLATGILLAKKGVQVTILEKNAHIGGRANIFTEKEFTFDMGPSWFLMPDVYEDFFNVIGENVEDHLDLIRLDPSYRLFFRDDNSVIDMHSDVERDKHTFEELEEGAGEKLKPYLDRTEEQYNIAMKDFVYKNYDSIFDFLSLKVAWKGLKLSVFSNMERYVAKFFKSDKIAKILQYMMVFLGSSPYNTTALYSIMNHIDFNMGVFYPQGGIHEIPKSLGALAEKFGATIRTKSPVAEILVEDGSATGVRLENGEVLNAEVVISNADLHFTDTQLTPEPYRLYSEKYWQKRTISPSAFIIYLGIDGETPELAHHNLIFSKDWKTNFYQIFDDPQTPHDPSLYICAPSITDPSLAPDGKSVLFLLVPIAAGLEMNDEQTQAFRNQIIETLAQECNIPDLEERIEFERVYHVPDFEKDYHSYMGSAFGLSHTMDQTAFLRPNNTHKKIKNMYFVGANTNPGIGMPMCLISAELAFKRIYNIKTNGPLEKKDLK